MAGAEGGIVVDCWVGELVWVELDQVELIGMDNEVLW